MPSMDGYGRHAPDRRDRLAAAIAAYTPAQLRLIPPILAAVRSRDRHALRVLARRLSPRCLPHAERLIDLWSSQAMAAPSDLAIPNEFRSVAALCGASEVRIGGRAVLGVPDARDLHRGLCVGRDFTNWIKGRIQKYGFLEHVDYEICQSPNLATGGSAHTGGTPSSLYRLTLNMAKELAMVENNDRGRLIRRYYIWLEEAAFARANPPRDEPADLDASPDGAPRFWLDLIREARLLSGREAARDLWARSPLPRLSIAGGDDGIDAFLSAATVPAADGWVAARELYEAYRAFRLGRGFPPVSECLFGRRVKTRVYFKREGKVFYGGLRLAGVPS